MIHLVLNSLYMLDCNFVILMNINLGMVLLIQSILCVHAELNLKPLNIFSCIVICTVLYDWNFFQNLETADSEFLTLIATNQVYVLLYGSQTNNSKSLNPEILKNVTSYFEATTRFGGPLINF